MSWREEARQDRIARARIEDDRAAAAARIRIEEAAAAADRRRADDQAAAAARAGRAAARAGRRAAAGRWLAGHVTDLLFVPVIAIPGLLAWTSMAAYGHRLYGAPGVLLPGFSEGAMWAFAAANTLTRRRHPGAPTWHLMAGTWAFAVIGAGLNLAHGLTAPGHQAAAGPGTGAVMALVSAAGVTAHQLITAGPRRAPADRARARLARAAARRELAVSAAAVRSAPARLDEHGTARLAYRPGLVTLRRRRIIPAVVPGLAVAPAGDGTDWDAALATLTGAAGDGTGVTGPGQEPGGGTAVAVADPPGNVPAGTGNAAPDPAGSVADLAAIARAAIARGDLPPRPSQRELRRLLGVRTARAAQVQRALDAGQPDR